MPLYEVFKAEHPNTTQCFEAKSERGAKIKARKANDSFKHAKKIGARLADEVAQRRHAILTGAIRLGRGGAY